ncbi:MAG: (Fe-S)-binding protein [Candidatus Nezhaarchaeota archaeon]|nr:(Fe-S)-binding protein [Candidatus Nezhaarchaeota archaeon]
MSQDYIWPVTRYSLEDYYEEVWTHCVKCKYCQHVYLPDTVDHRFHYQCPSGEVFKFEAYYASGRNELIRALLEGEVKWSDRVRHIIYTCTICGACEAWCMFSGRGYPLKAIEKLREYAVEVGQGPLPAHKKFAESVQVNHNPYGEPHQNRFAWLPSGFAPRDVSLIESGVVYFVGCTTSYRRMEIAQATVKVLEHLEIPFTVMDGEEWCCGSPLFRTGQVKGGVETLAHNIEVLRKMKAKKLIVSCAGCYKTFREAPRYGLKLPLEVIHVTQLLAPLIKELAGKGKIKLKRPIEKSTYHDPCHLRLFRMFEPPREILRAIGIDLAEMPRNRLNSFCCGYGGGVRAEFKDYALQVASMRLEEAKSTGANVIASICPFCKHNFLETAGVLGLNMKTYDVMELLAKALGL